MLYELRRLRRIHGNSTILDIEALDIEERQIYTLIGPNGAGKTTLLNLLAFLDVPTRGTIAFRGEQVVYGPARLQALRRRVSLVDQYPILFTGPVWKNVEFGLKVRKVPRQERHRIVAEVLEMVGMADFHHAQAHKLSGGETKRVALARALAIAPEVMLCDEPTANVDRENQEIILNILKRCNEEKHISLVFATHHLSQASRLANHTIVLQNGRLSATGRENIHRAVFARRRENVMVFVLEGDLRLAVPAAPGLVEGGVYSVHLDPRRLGLVPWQEGLAADNRWPATVVKAEQTGDSVAVTVMCASLALDVLLGCRRYADHPYHVGEKVLVDIPAEPAMLSLVSSRSDD